MSKKASPAAIGGFVLGALALLVIGILVFSGGALFRETRAFVSYFPGTVAGLNVGAPVQFQGVQIGQVTGIALDYFADERRFSIPVYYEIWPDALRYYGTPEPSKERAEKAAAKTAADIRTLVEERGLRAQLTPASLVTGQYIVTLDLKPDTQFEYVGRDPDAIEIPAVEATRDRLADMFQRLDLEGVLRKTSDVLDGLTALVNDPAMRALPENLGQTITGARKLVDDLDALVANADSTFASYDRLAQTATARIGSLAAALEDAAGKASGAFSSAEKAFGGIEDMVSPESATRTNLDLALEEAAGAARSLRILADYIEQNPDALIKGKY